MRLYYNKIKFLLLLILSICFVNQSFAQEAASVTSQPMSPLSVNSILCIIAIVLLFIIVVLALTVNTAIELYKKNTTDKTNKSDIVKTTVLLLCLLFISQQSFSQETVSTTATTGMSSAVMAGNFYFYAFITVIIVEVGIILFFIRAISFLTGIDKFKKATATKDKSIWQTINQFKPLEEEDNMDTGHNYDGIRELDNITPPWFTVGFVASILFAIVYIYRYEIAHTAPSEIEEYETEVREAKIIQDSLLKLEGNNVDENTVVMLGTTGIQSGKNTFTANCAACHGDRGQGGVGPNLTDEYWLHGGSIHDVFKSIKYGWQDKGMKSWKDDFSPTQIAQLASFVKSLRGSNPPNAKEKQGELYTDEVPTALKDIKEDSAKVK